MRPGISSDQIDSRPRKSSLADPSALPGDRQINAPTTFFLARDADSSRPALDRHESSQGTVLPLSSLQDTIEEVDRQAKQAAPRIVEGSERSLSRRRSTIRASTSERIRRVSSNASAEQPQPILERSQTPSPLPSQDVSLPSSPKSTSSRSVQKSDDGLTSDETGSQAIASSEDDEEQSPAMIQDSQPELIMPSIKMPSRRPFTARGKHLGRMKVLIAGRRGSGKTSLIKSIVQLCEDIVHVDPLASSNVLLTSAAGSHERNMRQYAGASTAEIYASTKPYPSWWSDIDESRILRRRKSVGDAVLERNICFVDAADASRPERVIHYIEQQLLKAVTSCDHMNSDFASLLSGRGGVQVDVVLYLISKDFLREDCETMRQLSALSNIVPLIGKSDLLSQQELQDIKQATDVSFATLPRLPAFQTSSTESSFLANAPYTVTSVNGPDTDTMDASLLMSPEYVQPLLPSELSLLVEQMFDAEVVAFLRHTSAKKLMAWHASHPETMRSPSPSTHSAQNSTLASPLPNSLSNSGVLIPLGSELSLNTSNSYALAKVADHAQREERLAQVRLSKWASDLQSSLQRERERYERLARGERAIWLVERMGEEVRGGQVLPAEHSQALVQVGEKCESGLFSERPLYQVHDPLGLLRWQDTMRTRGWIALQVVGSFGVVGGLALWFAKTWGFTSWAQDWSNNWFGHE